MAEPKIAVVGNCQTAAVRDAMQKLLPLATVAAFHVNAPFSPTDIVARIKEFDLVFTLFEPGHRLVELTVEGLSAHASWVQPIPMVRFSGFHPDIGYIVHDGTIVKGSSMDYHSMITVAGHLMGLTDDRIERLFNAVVFHELGYFDAYAASVELMTARASAVGYDLSSSAERWRRQMGAFVHTPNHPKIEVLSDVALMALKKHGLVSQDASAPTDLHDALADSVIAPVYPALARRLDASSRTSYQIGRHADGVHEQSLGEFISASTALYRTLDPAVLRNNRIPDIEARLERLLA